MAKKQGGGRLLPLPFTTFGELEALGLKARVYCSRCYDHRTIDASVEHLRDRCFATTRFRCTQIRYTGTVCGCLGSVEIEPFVLLSVGGKDTLAFLFCVTCEPSWEINYVPIDQQPWSAANRSSNDRFRCPGCGKAVAWRIHGPSWRPGDARARESYWSASDRAAPPRRRATGRPSAMSCRPKPISAWWPFIASPIQTFIPPSQKVSQPQLISRA